MDNKKLENLKKDYEQIKMSKEQVDLMKKNIENAKKEKSKKGNKHLIWKTSIAAAAAAFILIPNVSKEAAYAMSNIPVFGKLVEAVTFRNYIYESERHSANIDVPEIIPDQTQTPDDTDQKAKQNLKKTTEEINAEIKKITDDIIAEFKERVKDQEDYQNVVIDHETLATTDDYFALKLICYQGSGSGAEWDYYYTIDLNTGKRISLKDLFTQDADYITPISENIKEQMKQQMKEDENIFYWVDSEDTPEWNFEKITDETSFYLNKDGNIVICFNEGDVAPMYMGCVEFTIQNEAVAGILKN